MVKPAPKNCQCTHEKILQREDSNAKRFVDEKQS